MKRIFTLAIVFATTFISYSQSLGYQDLALLFSEDDNKGTARFTAMSGAFGAIGGDISAININPAGLGVYKNSAFSGTFNTRETDIAATYYDNTFTTQEELFDISHAGAVLVFENGYRSNWNKFAIGFNYRIKKDFRNSIFARGNSDFATFTEFPLDANSTPIEYSISDEQSFQTIMNGQISEFSVGLSAVHENKLYIGAAVNSYDLDFNQAALLKESNRDGEGNMLDASLYQETYTTGIGLSFNAGFIYKLHQNFRFGVSYQTKTWFTELIEETNITDNDGFYGNTEIIVDSEDDIYDNTVDGIPVQALVYRLQTPSKLTASAAFVFGRAGLISFDYTNKKYRDMELSDADFSVENEFFQNGLRDTHSFNVGTEWRIDRLSFRGGYRFEQSPFSNALETEGVKGYSFGGGYNFGDLKVDVSYSDNNRTGMYNFYPQFNQVNPADLTIDNRTITATVTLNL